MTEVKIYYSKTDLQNAVIEQEKQAKMYLPILRKLLDMEEM
jgi:hypothetical protein